MGNPSALAGFLLLLGAVSASPTSAQTSTLVEGAYERMSAANQKVAYALFDAQAAAVSPAPRSGAKTLTLDEIAARRRNGTAWGQVFAEMRARGLLLQASLGQVVSRYEHRSSGAVTAAVPKGKSAER